MIPYIGDTIDKRYFVRKLLVGNKRIRYYNECPLFQEALDQASWILNPTGLKLFFESIKLAQQCWEKMSIEENGICETFNDGTKKLYTSDGNYCSCSYYHQMYICRHIIFSRVNLSLSVFDEAIFHPCLLKDGSGISFEPFDQGNGEYASPPSPGMSMILDEQRKKRKCPSQSKKFNMAIDIGRECAEFLCTFETLAFDEALEMFTLFSRHMRRGVDPELLKYLRAPSEFNIAPMSVTSGTNSPADQNVTDLTDLENVPVLIRGHEMAAFSDRQGAEDDSEPFRTLASSECPGLPKQSQTINDDVPQAAQNLVGQSLMNEGDSTCDRDAEDIFDFISTMSSKQTEGVATVVSNVDGNASSFMISLNNNETVSSQNNQQLSYVNKQDGIVGPSMSKRVTPDCPVSDVGDDGSDDDSDYELPELSYTSRYDRDQSLQFETISRSRGRPQSKRVTKKWSANRAVAEGLGLIWREEQPSKQRKERSDKGKKRGKYKKICETDDFIDKPESSQDNVPRRSSKGPKNMKALVSEFGNCSRLEKCYTCHFELNYDLQSDDDSGDKVVKCSKCQSDTHASCVRNCGFCDDYDL